MLTHKGTQTLYADRLILRRYKLEDAAAMYENWTPGASGSKDMYDDLFPDRHTETFYCDIPFTRESWHGRMCACRGTLASMDGDTFRKWD